MVDLISGAADSDAPARREYHHVIQCVHSETSLRRPILSAQFQNRRCWAALLAGILALYCILNDHQKGFVQFMDDTRLFQLARHSELAQESYVSEKVIADRLALAFAEGLNRITLNAAKRKQQLAQSNSSTSSEGNETESSAQATPADGAPAGESGATEGSPGFEPSWVGTPSRGSDVPEGLRGSSNFVIADLDAIGEELASTMDDKAADAVVAPPAEAEERYFPFGRDDLVPQSPMHASPPPARPDSFRAAGVLGDVDEPDGDDEALRVVDELVPVEPPRPAVAWQAGEENGVAALFPDDLAPQAPIPAAPRRHRVHTDFDLQGAMPDLLIPADEFDPTLGEDVTAPGMQDFAVHVPPTREIAAVPPAAGARSFPDEWGDVYVNSEAAAAAAAAAVQQDEAAARAAVRSGRYDEALGYWAAAGMQAAGVDVADAAAPAPPGHAPPSVWFQEGPAAAAGPGSEEPSNGAAQNRSREG